MDYSTLSNRRKNVRHNLILRTEIHTKDHHGKRLKIIAFTHNVSSSGAYLDLPNSISINNSLFACIKLGHAAKLAAIGYIVRAEKKDEGLIGTGIHFDKTRLLSTLKLLGY